MEAAAKAFADWKPIRNEVIAATRDGRPVAPGAFSFEEVDSLFP
jgi:hypothetical protein